MKGSPVFPGFDTDYNDSSSYEFDPQTDFTQFLEEARRHANSKEVFPGESVKIQQLNVEKKSKKKSWKTALFSFWKTTEKKQSKEFPKEASMVSHSANPKRSGYVSGPVYRHRGGKAGPDADIRNQVRASGPLTSLFHAKKVNDIPYVSLDMLSRPQYDAKAYGPVYLVS